MLTLEGLQSAIDLLEFAEPGVQRLQEEVGVFGKPGDHIRCLELLARMGGEAQRGEFNKRVQYITHKVEKTNEIMNGLKETGEVVARNVVGENDSRKMGWALTEKGRSELA